MAEIIDLRRAKRVDFIAFRGDTSAFTITCTQPGTGAPFDLTGIDIKYTLKQHKADLAAVAAWTVGDGLVVAGESHNIIAVLSLAEIPDGEYYYDLQLTFPGGLIATYRYGKLTLTCDVS